jgi:hypothetical protein
MRLALLGLGRHTMSYFADWKEAHVAAGTAAREINRDYGIEKWSSPLTPGAKFRVFGPLPKPENCYGFEARCERVSPTDPL